MVLAAGSMVRRLELLPTVAQVTAVARTPRGPLVAESRVLVSMAQLHMVLLPDMPLQEPVLAVMEPLDMEPPQESLTEPGLRLVAVTG